MRNFNDNYTDCGKGVVDATVLRNEIYTQVVNAEKLPCAISLLTLKQHALTPLTSKRMDYFTTLSIRLPTIIQILESSYVYTVWNFIGEFGGWVGIFLGYCVADLADAINAMVLKLKENLCTSK